MIPSKAGGIIIVVESSGVALPGQSRYLTSMKVAQSHPAPPGTGSRLLRTALFSSLLVLSLRIGLAQGQPVTDAVDYPAFQDPPAAYRGIHWIGFKLSEISDDYVITNVLNGARRDAWGSFQIEASGGPTTNLSAAYLQGSRRGLTNAGKPYLSPEFFRLYRLAIEVGLSNNFPLNTLYDEWSYPSGIVGGLFYSKYPELAAKSLEIAETNVTGPAKVALSVPPGAYLGAVMMNRDTFKRVDISAKMTATNLVQCRIPAGRWKVMAFYLDATFRPASRKGGFVDYLDADAVAKYISLGYEPYYANLKDYFGTVIKRSFYDEPSMHLSNGRMWTPRFNQYFKDKYRYSPMTLYPALWYDIGPETAAARNALFGFRAELYAENYIGQVAHWCEVHGIKLAGHMDQEEARNPAAISGDLMKVFQHQQIPGVDDIYYPGRANVAYKIVTSAAFNYDRPECIAETYAAYRDTNSTTVLSRAALDQFAMGINMQIAARRPRETGPEMDRLVGRMSYLLRGGRHVADVAVLYPIAALQADYRFATPPASNPGNSSPDFYYALEGGIVPTETDYMDLGEMLYRALRVDYTYVHPEILVNRCRVESPELVLDNPENREAFRVLFLPGGDTLSAAAARKILEFYRGGGTVVATRKLPSKSAEFNRDPEVRAMTAEVFGVPGDNPMTAEIRPVIDDFKNYFVNRNAAGGRGYFLPQPELKIVKAVLDEVLPVRDVDIQEPPMWPVKMGTNYDGALTYIHKIKAGRDIYFFANSTDLPVNTKVALRGDKTLELWNPQTGEKQTVESVKSELAGISVTTVPLVLPPLTAAFYVQEPK
jgi:hypothetical protein